MGLAINQGILVDRRAEQLRDCVINEISRLNQMNLNIYEFVIGCNSVSSYYNAKMQKVAK